MITIHKDTKGISGKVRVTFAMPALDGCDALYLVGWFGEWDESVYSMECNGDNSWSLTLELEPGCEYLYSFRRLDGSWLCDPEAPPRAAQFWPKTSFVLSAHTNA